MLLLFEIHSSCTIDWDLFTRMLSIRSSFILHCSVIYEWAKVLKMKCYVLPHYSHSYSYTLSFSACHSISHDTTGHDPYCNLSWSLSHPLSAQTEHRKMALADLPSKEALWEGGEFALAVLNEVALFTHEVIKLLAFLRYHHPGVLLHAQSQCWKSK